jgi:hypothetical protein
MQAPFFQSEEVFHRYLALFGSIKEMLAKIGPGDPCISPSASVAEGHTCEIVAEPFGFSGIFGSLKTVGELKKRSSPLLIRQNSIRQQIDDRAIPAHMTARGNGINLLSQLGGKRNASPDDFSS